jgi:hypothetical protein
MADVSAAPSPASTPFPWPTLPTWSEVPVPAPFAPDGPPDASHTDRGVRVELWLSTPDAAPGIWVQALVRATNTRTEDVWYWPATCTAGTLVRVDLSAVTPMGMEQSGNAAVLKDIAISDRGILEQTFDAYDDVLADQSSGAALRPLAECVTPGNVRRLGSGKTRTERFAWYVATLGPAGCSRCRPERSRSRSSGHLRGTGGGRGSTGLASLATTWSRPRR